MSPLPDQWTTEAVGDLFEIQLGKMLSKKAKKGTSPFPYLANRHVQWGQVDLSDLEWMDFTDAEREKFGLRPNDLLVCEGGEVGRTAIWRGELEDCYFQKAVHRLRPKDGRVLPEFMYRFMEQAARKGLFSRLTSQTSIAHLTKEKLALLEMPLPPLPEQRRIAAILDKANAIRRKRQETIRLTEEFLRSAFLDMFGDPVTNPKGWPVKKLAVAFSGKPHIGTIVPALEHGTHPIVKVGDLGTPYLPDISQRVDLNERDLKRFEVKKGDLLLARAIGSEHHLGKASVFQGAPADPVVFDSHVMRVSLNPQILSPFFLHQWLLTPGGRANFMRRAGRTAVQFNINATQLAQIDVALPPIGEQRCFVGVFEKSMRMEAAKQTARSGTEELFHSLVQKAFRGGL